MVKNALQHNELSSKRMCGPKTPDCLFLYQLLYENIDQILPNKLHGPMHYKIGVTCVYNGQSNPHISQCNSLCNEFTSVWSYTIAGVDILFSEINVKVIHWSSLYSLYYNGKVFVPEAMCVNNEQILTIRICRCDQTFILMCRVTK